MIITYNLFQKTWHYLKCVVILKKEIDNKTKRQFYSFGQGSIIKKPFVQLSGCRSIAIGKQTTILDGCRLAVYGSGNGHTPIIKIGDRCYIGFNFSVLAAIGGTIKIGNDVLFASNIMITNESHGIDPESEISYMDQPLIFKDIEIGDGCWIGEKVCILPGVVIGKKSIIGAGSIVTHHIPEYSIAVGNPARVIKQYNFNSHRWEKVEGEK